MTGLAVRFGFVLRELEQVERALDVDLVRRQRGELRAGGEQRREVEHQLDLILGEHPLEQRPIEDRAGDLAIDQRGDRSDRAWRDRASRSPRSGLRRTAARSAPWPISPPAPVISTTGFRTTRNYTERVMLLLAARSAPVVLGARRRCSRRRRCRSNGPCAWTTSTPVGRSPARPSRSTASSTTAAGPAAGRSSSIATNLGPYRFEVRDVASGDAALFARLRVDLRRVGNDRRSADGASDLPRVGALPVAARSRCAS